jgi:hypothetical protein
VVDEREHALVRNVLAEPAAMDHHLCSVNEQSMDKYKKILIAKGGKVKEKVEFSISCISLATRLPIFWGLAVP